MKLGSCSLELMPNPILKYEVRQFSAGIQTPAMNQQPAQGAVLGFGFLPVSPRGFVPRKMDVEATADNQSKSRNVGLLAQPNPKTGKLMW